jgi:hypothetical protein
VILIFDFLAQIMTRDELHKTVTKIITKVLVKCHTISRKHKKGGGGRAKNNGHTENIVV